MYFVNSIKKMQNGFAQLLILCIVVTLLGIGAGAYILTSKQESTPIVYEEDSIKTESDSGVSTQELLEEAVSMPGDDEINETQGFGTSASTEIDSAMAAPKQTIEQPIVHPPLYVPEPARVLTQIPSPTLAQTQTQSTFNISSQFDALLNELLESKVSGSFLAPEHSKRVDDDIRELENKGYPVDEIKRLRELHLEVSAHLQDEIREAEKAAEVLRAFKSDWGECEDKEVTFTFFPMDPEVIRQIEPMGKMHGSHPLPTDHMYIGDVLGWNPNRTTYDVVAPADGSIVSVEEVYNRLGEGITDYLITIWHSCNVSTTFIHTVEMPEDLHSKIQNTFYSQSSERSNWGASIYDDRPAIPVKAGQVLGRSMGSFDFSVTDARVETSGIVVPEHYHEGRLHFVDPYDYFDEPLRSQLLAKNNRTVSPLGGQINYDVDGRLVGAWFLDGTIDYSGSGLMKTGVPYSYGHLGIAYDYITPSRVKISFGAEDDIGITDCDACTWAFGVKGNAPDPALVSVETGLVKYELVASKSIPGVVPETTISVNDETKVFGVFLVEMQDGRTIRGEVFPGQIADQVAGFTNAAQIYRR